LPREREREYNKYYIVVVPPYGSLMTYIYPSGRQWDN